MDNNSQRVIIEMRYNNWTENILDVLLTIEISSYTHHLQFTVMGEATPDHNTSSTIRNSRMNVPGHVSSVSMPPDPHATICDVEEEPALI